MNIERITKSSFAVIGKEGSTEDGTGFIQRLWEEVNSHFSEVSQIIKCNLDGTPAGIWGAMSDMTRSYKPWEDDFSRGLYLAGAECDLSVAPPEGWVKWIIPSYEYIRIESNSENAFNEGLLYLKNNNFTLAGAVHELTLVAEGKEYLYFPIKRM